MCDVRLNKSSNNFYKCFKNFSQIHSQGISNDSKSFDEKDENFIFLTLTLALNGALMKFSSYPKTAPNLMT